MMARMKILLMLFLLKDVLPAKWIRKPEIDILRQIPALQVPVPPTLLFKIETDEEELVVPTLEDLVIIITVVVKEK